MITALPAFALNRWNFARLCAVCTLALIPISTAAVNILGPLALVVMLTCREFWQEARRLQHNRTAIAAVALFLLLALSLLWGTAPSGEALATLSKYRKLLFIPFLLMLFQDGAWRRLAMQALFASLTVILILSCTNWLGWTHVGQSYGPDPVRASWVFKHHITQGIFTALLAYFALIVATAHWNRVLNAERTPVAMRAACGGVFALAMVNLFLVQQGRTGQVLIVPLLMLWGWQTFLRGRALTASRIITVIGMAIVVGASAVAYVAHHKQSRMSEVSSEIQNYERHGDVTSTGLRLEFYRRALILISQRPVVGYGVGSIEPQFRNMTAGQIGAYGIGSTNPHNEYLMMGVQAGALGILALVWLIGQAWLGSLRAPGFEGVFCAGYVAAFTIGCAANSLLLDFPEGHMFVFLVGILLSGLFANRHTPHKAGVASQP
nr:O-antigen ligase family protein [Ralstonia sp. ASV6]